MNKEKEKLYFDPEVLKQPTPKWMEDIGYIELEIKGESKK